MRSVGRRKTAAARVRLTPGTGKIIVNGKDFKVYFPYFEWQNIIMAPLTAVGKEKTFDISVKIVGGGQKGQAVAVQLGIARALVVWNNELKKSLKTQGYLTRDARVKERKKPGLKRARRAPQWSKR
ncbi:MAG: 30S ribosomal protein S9 [Patescibacteria group bacterium]